MRPRPLLVLVALVGLVLAACGRGGERAEQGPSVYGAGSTTSTTATTSSDETCADGDPSCSAGATTSVPLTTATTRRPPAGRPATTTTTVATKDGGGSGPPPEAEPAPGSGDVRPTATDDGSQGPPGAFARTLLRPTPATAIVLDRAAQAGAAIGTAVVDRSAGVLSQVTGKSVDVRPQATVASPDDDWSADEVRTAADAAATTPQGDGRAVLRLLLLRGTFEGSIKVLGVAVRGDVLALFVDNTARAATPLVSRRVIEEAVLLHELGHVLGLVDLARDTGRADKEHPGHSTNTGSVMYWAVESDLIGQVFNGPPPRDFDAQDLADLQALRAGA